MYVIRVNSCGFVVEIMGGGLPFTVTPQRNGHPYRNPNPNLYCRELLFGILA